MENGTVIIINGTSSSGKTSIVRALQDALTEPFLEARIDKFIWMLPERYLERPLWDDVLGLAVEAGAAGKRLFSGMHHAIASLAGSGNNVITDHVLVDPHWVQECIDLLSNFPVYLVGVHCPLEVLKERERSRRDRTPGQAAAQYPLVHAHMKYDVEVDTSLLNPAGCARRIIERMQRSDPPSAIKTITLDILQ